MFYLIIYIYVSNRVQRYVFLTKTKTKTETKTMQKTKKVEVCG